MKYLLYILAVLLSMPVCYALTALTMSIIGDASNAVLAGAFMLIVITTLGFMTSLCDYINDKL